MSLVHTLLAPPAWLLGFGGVFRGLDPCSGLLVAPRETRLAVYRIRAEPRPAEGRPRNLKWGFPKWPGPGGGCLLMAQQRSQNDPITKQRVLLWAQQNGDPSAAEK